MPLKHKANFNMDKPRKKGTKQQRMIARQEARKVINSAIETKHFYGRTAGYINGTYSGQTISVLTNPATLVNLIQGTDRDDYIGDTFKPVFLGVKYQIECLAGTFNTWTILVLQVKGGGTPLPVNVLQSVGNMQTPFSFVDPIYADTFRVLARRTVTAQFGQGTMTKSGYMKIPGRRMRKVNMVTPTNTPSANGLFIVFYNDASVSTAGIQLTWDLAFKDA